ncbi:PREDICTED: transmembrane protease serine 9 isoform X2 [Drosophila arizonae]|uniref:Transmembrane protease serine 9 isoform X2 n=1 Tax=Drosophila arizonae TaxID=7263 RepID=A0ABM1PCL4_DROAR|nr:PREDICTED: transmembrane protease serine 9 isoform X2 [Drosophila arizonae]
MNAPGKLISFIVWAIVNGNCAVSAEANCGRLEERLLFRKDLFTEPAEYPWIGLLVQRRDLDQKFESAECNVAIVGESHVLTTASCVRRFNNRPELVAVRLGIWDGENEPGQQYICNDRGFCVPGPVQYLVDAITMHPLADKDTGNNDIAILRLSQRINMTAYIQPVCLQPTLEPASWTSMDFHYGGFHEYDIKKGKGSVIAISRQYCNNETGTPPPENQFCGYPEFRVAFYKGAPMMGINVEHDVPSRFYLVGLLAKNVDAGQTLMTVFQDIRPVRHWILDNINSSSS